MDWHVIEENWKHAKLEIKAKWGKLTERDLEAIDGRRKRLEARLHKRYGFAPDHVRKEIDDWLRWQILKSEGRVVRARLRGQKTKAADPSNATLRTDEQFQLSKREGAR